MGTAVSVLMSVYNGEKYVAEAINSILNQFFTDFEFIIIDDGSTDKSSSIIESYKDERIIAIQQENRGLSASLNAGLRIARGKYIARMDADDISLPERFATQYKFLEQNKSCVVVGSNAIFIDRNGRHLYTSDQPTDWPVIKRNLPRTPFFHSSTFFRTEVAVKVGGYFEEIKQHFEDLIFFNKLSQHGELRNIKTPLLKYRIVPSAITNRTKKDGIIIDRMANSILSKGTFSEADLHSLFKSTNKKTRSWKESNYHFRIGKIFLEHDFNREEAIRNLLMSIKKYPFNHLAWFNLFLSTLPLPLIKKWKEFRGVYQS
jgi:glycosyltransferase involved in cell wall biosynthesis